MRSHSWLGPAEVVDAGPQGSTTVAPAAFAALIERRPAIDAVVFSNDLLALGALFEAQRRGVAVPGRVALIGFGGLDFGRNSVPALSTITPPRREIGDHVAEQILARIEGRAEPPGRVDLGFELIARESTRTPATQAAG